LHVTCYFLLLLIQRIVTRFPYTTLFRSGEIMYELIDTLGVEVDLEMATCIYTALYTDCGSFKYSNTMPKTMRIAAALLEIGVKPDRKSTRLNSSHVSISYAVFCLKKKT